MSFLGHLIIIQSLIFTQQTYILNAVHSLSSLLPTPQTPFPRSSILSGLKLTVWYQINQHAYLPELNIV